MTEHNQERPLSRSEQLQQAAVQIDGLASAGQFVTVDPEIAEFMAAFDDDALDEAEAIASSFEVDFDTGFPIFIHEGETVQ